MCGRYAVFTEEQNDEIQSIIDRIDQKYNQQISVGEVFPGTMCAILTGANEGILPGTPNVAHWGLNNPFSSGLLINARSETLLSKPFWKRMALGSRCIVPASGYYEWQKDGTRKYKKYIATNRPIMYMAGLLGEADVKGVKTPSFTIITTEPSQQISNIHDRMPAILSAETAQIWLKEKLEPKYFEQLLIPYTSELVVKSA